MPLRFLHAAFPSYAFVVVCAVICALAAVWCAVRLHMERKANIRLRAIDADIIQRSESVIRADAAVIAVHELSIAEYEREIGRLEGLLKTAGVIPWDGSSSDEDTPDLREEE